MKPDPKSLTYKQLAEYFQVDSSTIRKVWHKLPHYFVGTGRNLKTVRFDLTDVLNFMKNRDYVDLEIQNLAQSNKVQSQVQISGTDLPSSRVHDASSRSGMDHGKTNGAGPDEDADTFGLCDGLK